MQVLLHGGRVGGAALLFVLLFLAGCVHAQTPSVPQSAGLRRVLESWPARTQGGPRYELSIAPCVANTCPIEVRLLAGDTMIDAMRLEWEATAADARPAPFDANFGVGEPVAQSSKPRIWTTGEEEGTVAVSARLLAAGKGATAVLVDQMAGFEHPKRRHVIFAVVHDRLKQVWSRHEPPGPYWSTVATPAGATPPVHFSVFMSPTAEGPDEADIRRLVWNAERQEFAEQAVVQGLYGVIAGSYGDVAGAQAARQRIDGCLAAYWVLDSRAWSLASPRRYVVAALTTDRSVATAEIARMRTCAPNVEVAVAALQSRPAK